MNSGRGWQRRVFNGDDVVLRVLEAVGTQHDLFRGKQLKLRQRRTTEKAGEKVKHRGAQLRRRKHRRLVQGHVS